MKYRTGYRFNPTDEEIIRCYLLPKIEGRMLVGRDVIVEDKIYDKVPWKLNWFHVDHLSDSERYYFVKRTPAAASSKKRVKRTLEKDSSVHDVGHWKLSSKTPIRDVHGLIIGYRRALNFLAHVGSNGRGAEMKTEWLMHEYSLPDNNQMFQEWVVCKIKYKPREPKANVVVQDQQQLVHEPQPVVVVDDDVAKFAAELENDPILAGHTEDDDDDGRPCKRLHNDRRQQQVLDDNGNILEVQQMISDSDFDIIQFYLTNVDYSDCAMLIQQQHYDNYAAEVQKHQKQQVIIGLDENHTTTDQQQEEAIDGHHDDQQLQAPQDHQQQQQEEIIHDHQRLVQDDREMIPEPQQPHLVQYDPFLDNHIYFNEPETSTAFDQWISTL